MNKKVYQQPRLRIVNLHSERLLQNSNQAKTVSGNTDLHGGGSDGTITGGNGVARGRQVDVWDEEEEE